jgi:hypothetical protein
LFWLCWCLHLYGILLPSILWIDNFISLSSHLCCLVPLTAFYYWCHIRLDASRLVKTRQIRQDYFRKVKIRGKYDSVVGYSAVYCLHCPDDGGSTHLWNVGLLLRDYTAPYPRSL